MKTTKPQMAKGLITTLFLLAVSTAVQAQDFAPLEQSGKTAEGTEEVVNVQGDKGIEIVREVQNGEHLDFKVPEKKTAVDQVEAYLFDELELTMGWDDVNKRMFKIGQAQVTIEDPFNKDGIFIARDLLIRRAILAAKAEVISSIMMELSGSDQVYYPGTDVNKQLGAKLKIAQEALLAQAAIVEELLKDERLLKAAAREGVTFKDRMDHFMDWALKKLDNTYSKKNISKAKMQKYQKVRKAYQEALAKLNEVEAEADKLSEKLKGTQTSAAEMFSRMPLLGATVLWQSESWFKKAPGKGRKANQYEVAVLVVWSKGLEDLSQCAITGQAVKTSKPVEPSKGLNHYVRNVLDLKSVIGPHVYVDDDGNKHFLGISTRPGSTLQGRTAASFSARTHVVASLISDVEVFMKMNTQGNYYDLGDDMESVEVAESMEIKLTQAIKRMKVSGITSLTQKSVTHPLIGKRCFAIVYQMDPVLAARAPDLFKATHRKAFQIMENSRRLGALIAGVERDPGGKPTKPGKGGKPDIGGGSTPGTNPAPKPKNPSGSKPGTNAPKKPKKLPF